ncbi:MAG: DUF308 domain-containing protein [Clostridia bacterium]|nr:DUF308 domain-containing protein [Clostridia bacterium]
MNRILDLVKKGYLYALICLVTGLLLVIWPGQTVWGVYITAASALVVMGGLRIFRYFRLDAIEAHRRLALASGGIFCVIGALLLIYRGRLGDWLPELVGFALLCVCCIRAQGAIDMLRRSFDKWWWPLLCALLTLACALLCLLGSFDLNIKLILAGAALIVESGIHIFCDLWFSRTDRPARKGRGEVQPANYTYTWKAEEEKAEEEEPAEA